MRNKVKYEWSLETLSSDGDIEDITFSDTPFTDLLPNQRMCLVRDEGNEIDGLVLRMWAYVTNGKVPDFFSNELGNEIGYKVPVKYKSII